MTCGSKPVLLVDAVEIFLRLLDLSENQNSTRLFKASVIVRVGCLCHLIARSRGVREPCRHLNIYLNGNETNRTG